MKTHYLFGLPFATVRVRDTSVDALVDTGFDGLLALPRIKVADLKLPWAGSINCILADGTTAHISVHSANIEWFGEKRKIDVIAVDSDLPLMGMKLLRDARTILEPRKGVLTIEKTPAQ